MGRSRLKKFLIRKKTGQCTPEDMKIPIKMDRNRSENSLRSSHVDRRRFHPLNVAREEETI